VTTSDARADDQGPIVAAQPTRKAQHHVTSSGRSSPVAAPQDRTDDEQSPSRPRPLRIGDQVRSLVDDVCVSVGLGGLVVNVAPARYGAPARARILWDNETVSMADAHTFEVLGGQETAAASDDERVA